MQRNFRKTLLHWKQHALRCPLIVRGARQVGKTYAIEAFGREECASMLSINFEIERQYELCFEKMDPRFILGQIELISKQKIVPGETLLFLDEIQQCPRALQSLRYFKEKLPELHVIAAGSLLEFAIRDGDFSFPVGRVQFARMYPLSFEEYLIATGRHLLQEALSTFDFQTPPPPAIHMHLLECLKEYFTIGGMPAALQAYLQSQSYLDVKHVQK